MKVCGYCGVKYSHSKEKCPSCGAQDFSVNCENCGTEFKSKFCPTCGKSAEDEMKTCPKCKRKSFGIYCPQCGESLISSEANNYAPPNNYNYARSGMDSFLADKQRNKWIAFFLCLFLGFLGIHKFYENKIGLGIVYIFTGGLFFFGWLIDLITLLTKPTIYYIK